MDFSLPTRALEIRDRVLHFLEAEVIPLEPLAQGHELPAAALEAARKKARAAGLWAPQLPREYGGLGLDFLELCAVFEAAGRSLLGPLALGCAAPDEGNGHLLLLAGDEEQKARYLKPLAAGRIRSAFAMTEPPPGAGSDPTQMRTRARLDGETWVLDGEKTLATGARGAAFAIVCAVSDPKAPPRRGMTLFIVESGTPGFEVTREIPMLASAAPGGHCEIRLSGCRVGARQVLGGVGEGYRLLQKRLGPARLTHCMRWLGAAARALEIARDRARTRTAFGKALAEHQAVQWMLADSAMELHAARLMVYEAAWRLARGERARREISMCKVYCAEAVGRALDRAIQILGGAGVSLDFPLAAMYAEARAFRIYDGPSEVHRMVIAREILRDEGPQRAPGS